MSAFQAGHNLSARFEYWHSVVAVPYQPGTAVSLFQVEVVVDSHRTAVPPFHAAPHGAGNESQEDGLECQTV